MQRFEELVVDLRDEIEEIKREVWQLNNDPVFMEEQSRAHQHSEMGSNIDLAFRHLEDARMRLGKLLQAFSEDGVSKYDK